MKVMKRLFGGKADAAAPQGPDPGAAAQAQPGQPAKKRAYRARQSDVIDEHGRSAEELAAESAKEFDIAAVARKAAAMDAMDRMQGVERFPANDQPAAGSGSEGGKHLKVVHGAKRSVHSVQLRQRRTSTMLATADAQDVFGNPELEAESLEARDVFWDSVGLTDPESIIWAAGAAARPGEIAPLRRAPWPTGRECYRVVRTADSAIIASDGLSDPFAGPVTADSRSGIGLEVFIEVPGCQDWPVARLRRSWAARAVATFAQCAATEGGFDIALGQHGILQMDLPDPGSAPVGWSSGQVPGALVNVAMAPGMERIDDMPLGRVRIVPMTLLHPSELAACKRGGPEAREALADDLIRHGYGHRSDPKRPTLRGGAQSG